MVKRDGIGVRYVLLFACAALSGCGPQVFYDSPRPGEFMLNATPPGGMYGGFLGLEPSAEPLPKLAAELCPNGYDKVSETTGTFEGKYIHWEIRCHPAKDAQNSN